MVNWQRLLLATLATPLRDATDTHTPAAGETGSGRTLGHGFALGLLLKGTAIQHTLYFSLTLLCHHFCTFLSFCNLFSLSPTSFPFFCGPCLKDPDLNERREDKDDREEQRGDHREGERALLWKRRVRGPVSFNC